MKKILVLGMLLSLSGCGGDGYGDMRIDGNSGSALTSDLSNKPSNEFCKSLTKKTCLDVVNSHSSSLLACVEAQQLYSCGYTKLDDDIDGYLCEVEFANKDCLAPPFEDINFEWMKAKQ